MSDLVKRWQEYLDRAVIDDKMRDLIQGTIEEIEGLRGFIKAFDEMDEYQPYDGYYIGLIEKVWKAREALND